MSPTATPPSAQPDGAVSEAAERLWTAAEAGVPCPPVRDLIGADDVDRAYAVQAVLTARRLEGGTAVVGRKIGLTSPAVQRQLGVDRPDFGVLFEDMDVTASSEVPSHTLLQPKAEPEVAFVLAEDLVDGPLDADQVRRAVAHALGAVEIVDSRIANWDITFGDTVADNASSGVFVLGSTRLGLDAFEPRDVNVQMYIDGVLASHGNGGACMGDPLNALAWLARTARELGDPLRAGQLVLSGALGPMVATPPGTSIRAVFSDLGEVTATFSSTKEG